MLSTSLKIRIARALSLLVLALRGVLGQPSTILATRRRITWKLDLKEGIDFAIYLLGGFEVRTLNRYAELVRPGHVVLDIGANIGAHTLPLAQLVGPAGQVHAFEPTAFAFQKQVANIALNPDLAARIVPRQVMLTATDAADLPGAIYSSWPLERAKDLHDDHHGRLMGTEGAITTTLDSYLRDAGVARVDFIKIDVDGHELEVLRGGTHSLKTYRPQIMIELAPYVHDHAPGEFDELITLITSFGYELRDMATGKLLPGEPEKLKAFIPDMGGLNVLASAPSQA